MAKPKSAPKCHPDRKHIAKGLCSACYQKRYKTDPAKRERALESVRQWRQENKDKQNHLQRRWRRSNPEKKFGQDLKYKFGITMADWQKLVAKYGGACWICKVVPKTYLCMDHNHATGKVRGALCTNCNAGLGQFRDSTDLLLNALAYLGMDAIVE